MHWYTLRPNQYKFPLINLVPDEFKEGYPIAHHICNKKYELVLIAFFQTIMNSCSNPSLETNAVMTDNDNSRRNAFSRVFQDCSQLLCKWHVKRSWGNKISLCETQKLHEELYWKVEVKLVENQKKDMYNGGFLLQFSVHSKKQVIYHHLSSYAVYS